jgi:hypothetical protein
MIEVTSKGRREMNVKLLTVFMAFLVLGTLGFAQDVVSDVGKVATDTGRGSSDRS